ncbi:ABC transporter ATP-binding protein [Bifidobacterium callitrichidarum]|uniref:ABC transporter ATP-binding protein n=1 Tax=Bifidobacterium callitrichidarum TaxID=2052941 RepID=A0A2U2NC22_9BIFI|nr:ABC transporter ATP-binding protein [Bifidobacterium callitrichidarum]PWG66549.1 ABC transporter ATP-binding protein [Bifidobacterium callitrichidarum]
MPQTTIDARNLTKRYADGQAQLLAVHDISLQAMPGESIAIMGPSGCGKSTLLRMIGLSMKPTSGSLLLQGRPAPENDKDRSAWRNRMFGFIPQDYAILEDEPAWANVAIPMEYAKPGIKRAERKQRATAALEQVGLASKARRMPGQLSGGERQRIAIARATVMHPAIIIADEPTAALDTHTADTIMTMLLAQCRQGATLILATHDPRVAAQCDTTLTMRDGAFI